MFEQSFLNRSAKTHRPWTVAVSFVAQMALVGVGVLIPLVFTDALPRVRLRAPVEAPPPPPPPRVPEHVKVVAVVHQVHNNVLTEPVRIPVRVAQIVDPPEPPDPGSAQLGVPGGIDTGGGTGRGVAGSLFAGAQMIAPPPPPPAAVVKRAEPAPPPPIRVLRTSQMQEAKLIRRVIPVYPPLARAARISGTVVLQAIIDRDGRIQELKAVSGHPLLVPAAVEAVRQWLYQPTLLSGQPVEVVTQILVHFTLSQ